MSAPTKLSHAALGVVRLVPIAFKFSVLRLKASREHPGRPHVVAALLQRRNHLLLKSDVLFKALRLGLDFLRFILGGGAVLLLSAS